MPPTDQSTPEARVVFVNLKQADAPPALAAARLAAAEYGAGRRVLILAPEPHLAQEVDQALWTFEQGSFIPHAQEGEPDADQEPVLITGRAGNPNQAATLIITTPQDPLPWQGFPLVFLLVPASEGPELTLCRDLYRQLGDQPGVRVAHATRLP